MLHPATRSLFPFAATLAVLSCGIPAQVPDGHLIATSLGCSQGCAALGELAFIDSVSGSRTTVTGLPSDLTGQGGSIAYGGNAVLYWPAQGAVIAGTVVPTGSGLTARLHVVYLTAGNAYDPTRSFSIPLGVPGPSPFGGGGVGGQIAWLTNTTVVVSLAFLASGPAFGFDCVVVDLANKVILNGINVSPRPTGVVEALAVDRGTGAIFLAFNNVPGGGSTVVRTNLTGTAAVPPLLTLTAGGVHSMAYDADRNELVVPGGSPSLLRLLDPVTGANRQPPIPLPARTGQALAIERASSDYVVASDWAGAPPFTLYRVIRAGTVMTFTNSRYITGLDLNHNPEAFGTPTPRGGPVIRWDSVGGLPTLGNAAFTLRATIATGGWLPGLWFASPFRANPPVPIFGINLLIGPQPLITGALIAQTGPSQGQVPLPIPPGPALRGVQFRFQSLHIGGQLAASDAIEVTVL